MTTINWGWFVFIMGIVGIVIVLCVIIGVFSWAAITALFYYGIEYGFTPKDGCSGFCELIWKKWTRSEYTELIENPMINNEIETEEHVSKEII